MASLLKNDTVGVVCVKICKSISPSKVSLKNEKKKKGMRRKGKSSLGILREGVSACIGARPGLSGALVRDQCKVLLPAVSAAVTVARPLLHISVFHSVFPKCFCVVI